MRSRLLDVLACPHCRERLDLRQTVQHGDEVSAGQLECTGCHLRYPIEEGVPRMLIGRESASTRAAFTRQWQLRLGGHFEPEESVYGQDPRLPVRWLLGHCLGEVTEPVWALDAGCGSGEKAASLALESPAAQVVGMDLSDTVGATARRWHDLANLHVIQGDVSHPPLRRRAFAKAYSWGVLHHTPDTRTAFDAVSELVAPRGRLAVWLYPQPSEDRFFARYYAVRDRHFLGRGHRLPPRLLLALVRLYCLVNLPLLLLTSARQAKRRYRDRPYMIPRRMSLREKFRMFTFMIYDDIAPEFQFRHRRAEVLQWYRAQGFPEPKTDQLGLYWAERDAAP